MRVVERVAGRYTFEEVEDFGRGYRGSPESVIMECECGRRTTLKRSDVIVGSRPCCGCGAVPTGATREEVVLEVLDESREVSHHPWRYWRTSENNKLPI